MAAKTATRAAQLVQLAEFTFSIGDTMVNTAGAADAFASVAAHIFDVINLPVGAVVVGGEVVTDTLFTGATAYNVTVGDSASAARYLGTTDKLTAARTALVPTGYLGLGENIRLTVTPTVGAATAGKMTVRVQFVLTGKADFSTGS